MRIGVVAGFSALVLLLGGCAEGDPTPAAPQPSATSSDSVAASPSEATTLSPSPTAPSLTPAPANQRSVLAISVDGLNPDVLAQLGPEGAPAYFRLLEEGAATLNARTEVEQTVTLPNHTGMVTGRRIDPGSGGHGVTWNQETPGSVVPGQGNGVESVFDVVDQAGGSAALFASKDKLAIFERSWDESIDEFRLDFDSDRLVDAVRADLTAQERRLRFLHLALPDNVGHASGWMSPAYVEAIRRTDQLVGALLQTIEAAPQLRERMVVVLTADHGGVPGERDHEQASAYANFRVPFVVWGRGVGPGDLYELNPDYRDPGTAQPSYDGPQPVRNGDLANLVTDLLGLGPVPGSELGVAQDLDVAKE